MHDTLTQWHMDHVNFAKLLDQLETELQSLHDGQLPQYDLMLDIMYYMTHYSDVLHHPKEDLVFARVKERDHDAAAKVDELTQQHAHLHSLGQQLVNDLDDVVAGSIIPLERVESDARDYLQTFRKHMRMEEREVLPLAAKLLRDVDWTEIGATIRHVEDPLFGTSAEQRYAALHRQITRGVQARG
jgi:hemerythrin-like domain-containing protein